MSSGALVKCQLLYHYGLGQFYCAKHSRGRPFGWVRVRWSKPLIYMCAEGKTAWIMKDTFRGLDAQARWVVKELQVDGYTVQDSKGKVVPVIRPAKAKKISDEKGGPAF